MDACSSGHQSDAAPYSAMSNNATSVVVPCEAEPQVSSRKRPRLLIFIVAYHAETTIRSVLARLPHSIQEEFDTEILVIDDASNDRTFERSQEVAKQRPARFPLTVLFNPVNQGYGGNQKIGFCYAIKNGFDFVALIHGDGQYAPECLPDLVASAAGRRGRCGASARA